MLPPFDPWLTSVVAADVVAATWAGSDDALETRRERRLRALLAAAAARSPMYRRLLGVRAPAQVALAELPIARKPDLMRRFDEWVADPVLRLDALRRFVADPARIGDAFAGRYLVWESSGSSGEPAVFVQDAAALAAYDALEAWRRPALRHLAGVPDPWGLTSRFVFVGAVGGHFAATVSIERLRRLNPLLGGRVRSVSFLQPVAELVAALHEHDPTVIATYPSAAVLLAQERCAGRLRIAPREIWTGGETLSPAMRAFVRDAFGCPVVDSYGASEFLSLAWECGHGALHLNSDWAILEPVDDEGRAVPPGTFGATTLLTNLANHVQPLIRYDIGDRVRLREAACGCGCRLPVLEVQGRCDDSLQLGPAGAPRTCVLGLALTTVLEDEAGVFDFQVVQTGPSALELCSGGRGHAVEDGLRRGRDALLAFFARHGAGRIRVRCLSGRPLRRGRTGKIPRVIALG